MRELEEGPRAQRADAMPGYALAGEVGVFGVLGAAIRQVTLALFGELSATLGVALDFNAADNEPGHCGLGNAR